MPILDPTALVVSRAAPRHADRAAAGARDARQHDDAAVRACSTSSSGTRTWSRRSRRIRRRRRARSRSSAVIGCAPAACGRDGPGHRDRGDRGGEHAARITVSRRSAITTSTYTLMLVYSERRSDLLGARLQVPAKGCFSIDCAPDWTLHRRPRPRASPPVVDMLARDYASYRHALIVAMQKRVPGWQPTSDADPADGHR